MESNSNQRLSDRFADIERWMIPTLLLLIVVVGVIRIMPWVEEKIFPSGVEIAEVSPKVKTTDDSSNIEVDLELAPVILDDDKDLPEARSEDLTNSLNTINETLTIEIQTDAADNILTSELEMDQILVEESTAVEITSNLEPEDPIATANQETVTTSDWTTKRIAPVVDNDQHQVPEIEANLSEAVPDIGLVAKPAPEVLDQAKLDELSNAASDTLASISDLTPVEVEEPATQPVVMEPNEAAALSAPETEPLEELVSSLPEPEPKAVEPEAVANATIAKTTPLQDIEMLMNQWALAWVSKDVNQYLAAYSSDHKGLKHSTAAQWREWRTQRIQTPVTIDIKISKNNIFYNAKSPNFASAQFTQDYQTPKFADIVIKRLEFERQAAGWKIIKERTIETVKVNRS